MTAMTFSKRHYRFQPTKCSSSSWFVSQVFFFFLTRTRMTHRHFNFFNYLLPGEIVNKTCRETAWMNHKIKRFIRQVVSHWFENRMIGGLFLIWTVRFDSQLLRLLRFESNVSSTYTKSIILNKSKLIN